MKALSLFVKSVHDLMVLWCEMTNKTVKRKCLVCAKEYHGDEVHCGKIECKVKVRVCYDHIACKDCGDMFWLKKMGYRTCDDKVYSEELCIECVKKHRTEAKSEKMKGKKFNVKSLTAEEKKERSNKRFYADLRKANENIAVEIQRCNIKNAYTSNIK